MATTRLRRGVPTAVSGARPYRDVGRGHGSSCWAGPQRGGGPFQAGVGDQPEGVADPRPLAEDIQGGDAATAVGADYNGHPRPAGAHLAGERAADAAAPHEHAGTPRVQGNRRRKAGPARRSRRGHHGQDRPGGRTEHGHVLARRNEGPSRLFIHHQAARIRGTSHRVRRQIDGRVRRGRRDLPGERGRQVSVPVAVVTRRAGSLTGRS